jgi:hypothetical protein
MLPVVGLVDHNRKQHSNNLLAYLKIIRIKIAEADQMILKIVEINRKEESPKKLKKEYD